MKRPNWKLGNRETIVCAFPEYCSGPGWANRPVWVIVKGADHALRMECLQPDEQSVLILNQFAVAELVNREFTSAVRQRMERKGK